MSSLVPPSHPHTWLMYGLMFWLLQSRMSTIVMASSSPMLYYITIKEHNVFTLENIFIYLDFFNNIIISYFSSKVFFVIIYIYFLYITCFSKKSLKVFRLKAAILGLLFVNLVMFNCSLLFKTCLNVYSPTSPAQWHPAPPSHTQRRLAVQPVSTSAY